MQICHKQIMVKVALTHIKRDKARRDNLKTTSPIHMQTRLMGSQIRTLESGVSSTKSPSTTLMNTTHIHVEHADFLILD
jgi:hypothetical protein